MIFHYTQKVKKNEDNLTLSEEYFQIKYRKFVS